MSNIITDETHSLEMGGGSNKKKIVVCPHCKTATYVSVNWISGTCQCGKYFNLEISLNEDEADNMSPNRISVDRGRIKLKMKMEKEAHEWASKQNK